MNTICKVTRTKQQLSAIVAVGVLFLVSACQHHPQNKVGKAYDANSARCIWGNDFVLVNQQVERDLQANGHKDHFNDALEKQDEQVRKEKDCESKKAMNQRRNKASLQAEIDKAIK